MFFEGLMFWIVFYWLSGAENESEKLKKEIKMF